MSTTLTHDEIMTRHSVELPTHLEAQATIPITHGIQRQGDLIIIPTQADALPDVAKQINSEGIPVVRGVAGGNTHLLVADGDVKWHNYDVQARDLGIFKVAKNATAFLLHPEHGAQGFAPGEYIIRRQREMADEIRIVAD